MLRIRKSVSMVGTVALLLISTTTPALSAAPASGISAKAKITKPSAPTIVSIVSSTPKKGKVNLKVTISLPESNGGSKITGSKVTAGGKSCMIKKTKTSCTLKSIKNGKTVKVFAASRNKKGFGPRSAKEIYVAGAGAWSTTPAAAVATEPLAPTVSLSCATGETCVVGDTGPGGGIVYYVNTAGFNCGETYTNTGSPNGGVCKYLEVAPSGWNTVADPIKLWAVATKQGINVSGITNETTPNNSSSGIGLGYKNSVAIVAQGNDDTTAAGAARAYAGGGKGDWYLPTTAELNLLCQWNRGVPQDATPCTGGTINTGTGASGGFLGSPYWSSSEASASDAWFQYFANGGQFSGFKGTGPAYVRPVRAF